MSPGSPAWRIWADYDNDGMRDSRRALRRHRRERRVRDHRHQPADVRRTRTFGSTPRSTACASSAPAAAPAAGPAPTRTPRPPAASPRQRQRLPLRPRPDRRVHAQGHGQGLRQLPEAEDHGDQGSVPTATPAASTSRSTASPSRRRPATAARADLVKPGTTRSPRPRPAPTSPTTRPRLLQEPDGPAHLRPRLGHVTRRRGRLHDRNIRKGKVEIVKQTDPAETGGTRFAFTGFAGDFSLAARPDEDRHARHPAQRALRGDRVERPRLPAVKSITCNDDDSTGTIATRTASIRVAAGENVRCTFVNTKLGAGHRGGQGGPGAGPPRRHDGLHVRRAQHRQLAAARRQRDRQPLRPGLRHPGLQERRRPGRRCSRATRCGSTPAPSPSPRTRPARRTRCATSPPRPARTSRASRSATPTTTARTSSTRRSTLEKTADRRPRRWATRSATRSTSPTPATSA